MGLTSFFNKPRQDKDDNYDESYYMEDSEVSDEEPSGFVSANEQPVAAPAPAPQRTSYSAVGAQSSSSPVAMKLMKPSTYEEGMGIADKLIEGCAVVMNLENTNKETAANLIYFLTGVIYAIDGHMKLVSTDTYMLTPHNMEVTEDGAADEGAADYSSFGSFNY